MTFDGTYYRISDLDALPDAKPKVLVGANGRRMLRLAARYADILNFPDRPPVGISMGGNRGLGISFADQLAIVNEAAGERYAELELSVLSIPRVTDQPHATFDEARAADADHACRSSRRCRAPWSARSRRSSTSCRAIATASTCRIR